MISNGVVVPRVPIGPLLPAHFVPFQWNLRPILHPPSPDPARIPTSSPLTNPAASLNSPLQYSHLPAPAALALVQPPPP